MRSSWRLRARRSAQALGVMTTLIAAIDHSKPAVRLDSEASLDAALDAAAHEARHAGRLNVISLIAPNGDKLTVVLGGVDTVVGFTTGSGTPPYFASAGNGTVDTPVLTAFVQLEHHTEFSRRWVVPVELGRRAAREFMATGRRPASLAWLEV
jgi:Immunity protein Imm1